jgi:circadian clock protein KaiB
MTSPAVSVHAQRPPDSGSNNDSETYLLRLYVAGASPRSSRAIANLKAVCEEYLAGRFRLEIIDLYQHPGLARTEQIVALPTLHRALPLPFRRLVGDLTDKHRLLLLLGVEDSAPVK